ncbi:peptidoglycan-binding domain-containing protein [Rhizobium sp. CSW-27]|uniref:peptidoglycan-binding domain-containing protein n=1 Tax=Rhizobium sp. CSW-27 TaxID=2839985 RepID=UPI001C00AF3E|nr:peptidoglycan-binding domain-containing protein [Rhizobium sp. CSW-27]MBT9373311.1 peptidoglycan-binding protein [Rhizobium sp. CSW-27]
MIGLRFKSGAAMLLGGLVSVSPLPDYSHHGAWVPPTVRAQGLDGLAGKLLQGLGAAGSGNKQGQQKKKKKNDPANDVGEMFMQGVGMLGVGLAAGGLMEGKTGPIVIGTIMAAAPILFRQEMEQKYGREQAWAGCINCNQQRVLVRPGAKVSDAQRSEAEIRIRNDAKDLQGALAQLGFYTQKIDGSFGAGSRKAVAKFQKSIDEEPTEKLTAEQRRTLFLKAREQGFAPQFDLAKASLSVDAPASGLSAVPPSSTPSAPTPSTPAPTLKEFKLAESQIGLFSDDVVKAGKASMVKDVRLLSDGVLEITVNDTAAASGTTVLRGGVETIAIQPHALSDLWMQVVMTDSASGSAVTLNTLDSFKTAQEAAAWKSDVEQRIVLLGKLTERDIAPSQTITVAETGQTQSPDVSLPVETAKLEPVPATQGASSNKEQVSRTPQACGSDIYVSFEFPSGDNPINHYNIVPPEGTVMVDNGDSTAYFTGPCVQGRYDYKYVVVTHDEKKKSWGSFVREGSFEIASLSGQCEVRLNEPGGSATLKC